MDIRSCICDAMLEFDPQFGTKPKQIECFQHLLSGNDVIANLQVGYDKSLIYQELPGVFQKLFVHSPKDVIVDHSCEYTTDGQWSAHCLTERGDVYMVNKHQIEENTSKSSRDTSEEIEIFSDLLGQPEDTINTVELKASSRQAYILRDTDVIIASQHKQSIALCISPKYIIIVASTDMDYYMYMYEKSKHKSCTDEKVMKLPKKFPSEAVQSVSSKAFMKIVTCDCIEDDNTTTSGVLNIDTKLFKQLFGENNLLLNSPVVILTHSDGSVYFASIATFVATDCSAEHSKARENMYFDTSWKLLCQMSDSVTEIITVSLPVDGSRQECTRHVPVVCICSQDGQMTIFHTEHGNSEAVVSDICVCSPVLTVCSWFHRLYYSNGSNVFESSLEVNKRENQLTSHLSLNISRTRVLNEIYVRRIHDAVVNRYVESQASPCTLYCSLLNGDMKTVDTETWMDFDSEVNVSGNKQLKDILTSIDDVDTSRELIKNQNKVQEHKLRQLGIASYMMGLYEKRKHDRLDAATEHLRFKTFPNESKPESRFPVHVGCKPKLSESVEDDMFIMDCEITNLLSVTFSSGWSIAASISSTDDVKEVVTVSRKLECGWKANETITLSLTIPFNKMLIGCRLDVKAVILADNLETYSASIPLYEAVVDVIDCLVPNFEKSFENVDQSNGMSTVDRQIKKLAEDRILLPKSNTAQGQEDVTVSTRNIIHFSPPVGGEQNNIQEKVEHVLLRELFGRVLGDQLQHNDVHMRTVRGHDVYLSILQVEQTTSGPQADGKSVNGNETSSTFEVIVRSSPRIAAAMHRAINHREYMLSSPGAPVMPEVSTLVARRMMQTVQNTSNQISSTTDKHMSDGKCKLFYSTFQKLRNIQL